MCETRAKFSAFLVKNRLVTIEPEMERLSERLRTFEVGGWVSAPCLPLPLPFILASAGFFYLGHGFADRVKCHACGLQLMSFDDKKMCPFTAHVTYSPDCPFVKKEQEKRKKELCDKNDCQCQKEPTDAISELPLVDDLEKWSFEETKKHLETLCERVECGICKVKRREIIFTPCYHLVVCRVCSTKIGRECPICRDTIRDRKIVFFS